MTKRSITVLGATGSIGLSTLDVIRRHPDRFSVYALTAGTRAEELATLCREFRPTVAVMADAEAAERLQDRKSTRLNSSHVKISYAVFCLKKKNQAQPHRTE